MPLTLPPILRTRKALYLSAYALLIAVYIAWMLLYNAFSNLETPIPSRSIFPTTLPYPLPLWAILLAPLTIIPPIAAALYIACTRHTILRRLTFLAVAGIYAVSFAGIMAMLFLRPLAYTNHDIRFLSTPSAIPLWQLLTIFPAILLGIVLLFICYPKLRFPLLTIPSLALFVFATNAWAWGPLVRSGYSLSVATHSQYPIPTRPTATAIIVAYTHGVQLYLRHDDLWNATAHDSGVGFRAMAARPSSSTAPSRIASSVPFLHYLGIDGDWSFNDEPGHAALELTLPYYILILLSLPAPILHARYILHLRRQQRRLANHLCPHCSYDLRAHQSTPNPTCPECGKPANTKPTPASPSPAVIP